MYVMLNVNRPKKRGGGVALLASKEYQLTTIKTSASNDIQVLTANCVSKNQYFVVTIVYKAPQTDILTFQNFPLEHLFAMGPKNNHILCGDLNIDFSKYNKKTENFLREIGSLSLYLKSKKNEHTRETIRSNSTLDVFFSNFECETEVLKTKVSDHYGVCLKVSDLNDDQNNTIENEREKQRNWNALNRFTNVLELNVELSIELKSKDDFFRLCTAEEGIRNLENIINKTLDLLTPKKIITNKKRRNWITNEVKNACSKKQRLWNNFLQSRSQEVKKQYNLQNNKTKTLVRNAKKNYYEKIFDKQNDSNGKSFYRYLNQICHPNKKTKSEITNTIDSETLNNFFINIGPSLAKKIEKPYDGNMINRVVDSFVLKPIQNDEVKSEIKELVGKKSSDYMGLTNYLLKTINPVISGYLTDIFNKIIDESHYPESLKVSKVVPIFKDGDPSEPNNYIPAL